MAATETIRISFRGGKKVRAQVGSFDVDTDREPRLGGTSSAPDPEDLFLAAVGTAAASSVLDYLDEQEISWEGIEVIQRCEHDRNDHPTNIALQIHVPANFPEHNMRAMRRVVEGCHVCQALQRPPKVSVMAGGAEVTSVAEPERARRSSEPGRTSTRDWKAIAAANAAANAGDRPARPQRQRRPSAAWDRDNEPKTDRAGSWNGSVRLSMLVNKGFDCMRKKDYTAAREYWEKAKELDPDNRAIELNLSRLDDLEQRNA